MKLLDLFVSHSIGGGGVGDLLPYLIAGLVLDPLIAILLGMLEQRGALGVLCIVLGVPKVIRQERGEHGRYDRAADPVRQNEGENPDEARNEPA